MRQSDRALVNLSDVEAFLQQLQQDHDALNGRFYCAYGNKLFTTGDCIIRAHVGDNINPFTEIEELENCIMNAIRISIKHAFVVLCNCWKIMTHYDEFKRGLECPHSKELLVVAYLLSNICVTFKGHRYVGRDPFLSNPLARRIFGIGQ